jgi:hypothetical protein
MAKRGQMAWLNRSVAVCRNLNPSAEQECAGIELRRLLQNTQSSASMLDSNKLSRVRKHVSFLTTTHGVNGELGVWTLVEAREKGKAEPRAQDSRRNMRGVRVCVRVRVRVCICGCHVVKIPLLWGLVQSGPAGVARKAALHFHHFVIRFLFLPPTVWADAGRRSSTIVEKARPDRKGSGKGGGASRLIDWS